MRYTIILTVLLSQSALAADISECNLKKTADDRAECMASYSGSALFCDKIQSWERRQHCVRSVIRKQRQLR